MSPTANENRLYYRNSDSYFRLAIRYESHIHTLSVDNTRKGTPRSASPLHASFFICTPPPPPSTTLPASLCRHLRHSNSIQRFHTPLVHPDKLCCLSFLYLKVKLIPSLNSLKVRVPFSAQKGAKMKHSDIQYASSDNTLIRLTHSKELSYRYPDK